MGGFVVSVETTPLPVISRLVNKFWYFRGSGTTRLLGSELDVLFARRTWFS